MIEGFNSLENIAGELKIWDNNMLKEISGFNEIKQIIGRADIDNNAILKKISGFKKLEVIETGIHFNANALVDFGGFDNLKEIGYFALSNNSEICVLDGFNKLEGTMIDFSTYNVSISDLSGFNNLSTVGWIRLNNTSIQNLSGFTNVKNIEISLAISSCHLETFAGFDNLLDIGEELYININDGFNEIAGLKKLKSVGKSITLQYNDDLNNIEALDTIDEVGEYILINGNPQLSICNINIVCKFLEEGKTVIGYNKEGCNSNSEVLQQCRGGLSIDENEKLVFSIYPNPTQDILNIEYESELPEKLELLDLNGRLVLEAKPNKSINLKNLNSGIYLVRFTFEDAVYLKKIIKY
ncbi:T9SS type A sorting domain-containing protein [Leeuwenhoekiella sp. NPDC079379]|uniref:T9SS type A sorting domain-containing protein n=1 Tax=Leeuwenhoekiella sp. NPDC079379 TaxID=3364122 RepID=UPI0037CA9DD5